MIIACAYYSYKSGSRNGWDEAIFSLEDAGYLYVDDNGKVNRISDKEFKQIQSEMNE
jgi:hypothetical protein